MDVILFSCSFLTKERIVNRSYELLPLQAMRSYAPNTNLILLSAASDEIIILSAFSSLLAKFICVLLVFRYAVCQAILLNSEQLNVT